jgi:hypothetical protein
VLLLWFLIPLGVAMLIIVLICAHQIDVVHRDGHRRPR